MVDRRGVRGSVVVYWEVSVGVFSLLRPITMTTVTMTTVTKSPGRGRRL